SCRQSQALSLYPAYEHYSPIRISEIVTPELHVRFTLDSRVGVAVDVKNRYVASAEVATDMFVVRRVLKLSEGCSATMVLRELRRVMDHVGCQYKARRYGIWHPCKCCDGNRLNRLHDWRFGLCWSRHKYCVESLVQLTRKLSLPALVKKFAILSVFA